MGERSSMQKICMVDGCHNPSLARNMCSKHWQRWRYGRSLPQKSILEKTVEERFWEKVDKKNKNGCWMWIGHTRGNGKLQYGKFDIHGKQISAHRMSWILTNGDIPDIHGTDKRGTCILHKCDNTLCVNPSHLFVGTHADNMRDKVIKGRDWNKNKTHCPSGHEYSKQNTYLTKDGIRMCKD